MIAHLFSLLATGFLLGIQHSFDPDHVAAVSTIASRSRRAGRSALVGAMWGLGHTASLLAAGLTVVLLKLAIPPAVSQTFELLVGLMLVYLGARLFTDLLRGRIHLHQHRHGEVAHTHWHSHAETADHHHLHKPLLIGVLHGLAGSAGLVLLTLATTPSTGHALLFMLTFGVGSTLGMVASGALLSVPFRLTGLLGSSNRLLLFLVAGATTAIGCKVLAENASALLGGE